MFYNCESLKSLPDISKIDINKELNKENIFEGCNEKIIPKISNKDCSIY